ncbi:MAG: hypothetical protein IPO67_07855 [Deltaproteobacteria bacterium]|nr:hypothetical protein [Deltaproteobacteria bacterium]
MLTQVYDYWDGDCVVAWMFTTEPHTEDFCPNCEWQITLSRTLDTSRTTCDADDYSLEDVRFGMYTLGEGYMEYIYGGLESAAYGTRGYLGYFYYFYDRTAFLDEGMPDLADRWYDGGTGIMSRDSTRFKLNWSFMDIQIESTGTRYYGEIVYAYGEIY